MPVFRRKAGRETPLPKAATGEITGAKDPLAVPTFQSGQPEPKIIYSKLTLKLKIK